MLIAPAAFGANALPTVTAFPAHDSDGVVVGYMITETSTKPAATASGWSATIPTSYVTTRTGAVTLYAWAKDNAAGVSAAKTATTTIVSGHTHNQSDIVGLASSLAAKVDASAFAFGLAAKADVTALDRKSDILHNHDAVYQKKYSNTIIIAKSGGDFADPVAAINSISDASESNAYLLKIMPGVYNIGGNAVKMKRYVDIEGSGETTTKIISNIDWFPAITATVVGSDNAEIRFLTIENTGSRYTAAFMNNGASPKMTNITINASGYEVTALINMNKSNPVMVNVTSHSTASQGIRCWAIYNDKSSPVMKGVTAIADGSYVDNIAITNVESSPTMDNVIATGGLGQSSLGMGISNSSSNPIMNNVTATGSGYNYSYGVSNSDSVPVMNNVTIKAVSANNTVIGISSSSSATTALPIKLSNSSITVGKPVSGSPVGVIVSTGTTFLMSNTTIDGGSVQNSGTLKCAGVYDGNLNLINCN